MDESTLTQDQLRGQHLRKIYDYFIREGKPFGMTENGCVYSENGVRCAIGILLDDDVANFLGSNVGQIQTSNIGRFPQFIQDDMIFYRAIQKAHDAAIYCGTDSEQRAQFKMMLHFIRSLFEVESDSYCLWKWS